jgi:hypothetical protein
MLPMWRLTCALVILTTTAGCKNQTTGQFTNPFLTADKVPPPSTRVLAPGTAQPYYQGDPAPAGAFPQPTIGQPIPGAAAPPGAAYPGYGTTPPAMSAPPSGWTTPGYPPQSSIGTGTTDSLASFSGEAVSVPTDNQALRFNPGSASTASFNAPANNPQSLNSYATAPADVRLPIQSMLPLGSAQGFDAQPQRLTAREVTSAEYMASTGAPSGVLQASTASASDGFRPQGSTARSAAEPDRPDQSFRPPAITREGLQQANDSSTQFAAGANFETLRGQLEYWPETGAWSLRYLQAGTAADSLGGRVMIENPQVLANLPPGELVSVRGQLFGQQDEEGNMTAAYRVSAVERQQQRR